MGKYHIRGGNRTSGEISIKGAKNSVLPILTATVLNNNISIVHNCPRILDTFVTIEILESIGCKVEFKDNTVKVDSRFINSTNISEQLVKKMRSSIIFLGGLLGRFNEVSIGYPGGCELGARPIDLHLNGIKQLGAKIQEDCMSINCSVDKLRGTKIAFDFPSVGATQNIMLCSVYAEGTTIISNAAKEPEVMDLQNFLNSMGADIKGAGTSTIIIEGVKKLNSVEYTVMPDRIVAGTYLVAAAMTKGDIILNNIVFDDMYPITSKLSQTGCYIKFEGDRLFLKAPEVLSSIEKIVTCPHPGFPTDMQPQFMAMFTIANGCSVIEENIFEARDKHISELLKMNANITCLNGGSIFVIKGKKEIEGSVLEAKDLRGGDRKSVV